MHAVFSSSAFQKVVSKQKRFKNDEWKIFYFSGTFAVSHILLCTSHIFNMKVKGNMSYGRIISLC
jgi:hypothetical protein